MISTKSYILGKFFIFPIVKFLKPFRKGLEPRDPNPFIEGRCGANPFYKDRDPYFFLQCRPTNILHDERKSTK